MWGRLVPVRPGRAGPDARLRQLPGAPWRTAQWSVTAQRAGTQPQARAKRRWNVVKRRAAIAAEFSSGVGCPQPVAASGALRINALHSPTRQILHAFLPSGMTRNFSFTENFLGSP